MGILTFFKFDVSQNAIAELNAPIEIKSLFVAS